MITFLFMQCLGLSTRPRRYQRRRSDPLSKCNWELFSSSLEATAAAHVEHSVESAGDIDELIRSLESDIISALDEACPLKEVPSFKLPAAASTVALIKLKRRVRKKAQKDPSLKPLVNKLNSRIATVLKAERTQNWQKSTAELNYSQGHAFWQKFKTMTGSGKQQAAPKLCDSSGFQTTNYKQAADLFAEQLSIAHRVHEGPHFDHTARVEIEKFVVENPTLFNPVFVSSTRRVGDWLTDIIGVEEVLFSLKQCSNRSSPGPDGISYLTLKHLPDYSS